MTKQEARAIVKRCRAELSEADAVLNSGKICEQLIDADVYKEAEQIFCYASLPGEVRMDLLMERALADCKILALPRVSNGEMIFYRIESLSDLHTGYRGILEPGEACESVLPDQKTLLIMPGLAFDRARRRVGFGGGFYDRYLDRYRDGFLQKIAPAYDFQLFDTLEEEFFDRRPDRIITPGGIL